MRQNLKRTLLLPLLGVLFLLSAFFIGSIYHHLNLELDSDIGRQTESVRELYRYQIEQDAREMRSLADVVISHQAIINALAANDRNTLLNESRAFLKSLLSDFNVTQLCYYDSTLNSVIRVDRPGEEKTAVQHTIAEKASKSRRKFHGLELDSAEGKYMLYVAAPVFDKNGAYFGVVELGKDFRFITGSMREIVGTDLSVVVHKNMLDKARWEAGMQHLGIQANWNQFRNYVIVEPAREKLPSGLQQYLARAPHSRFLKDFNTSSEDQSLRIRFLPLEDDSGQAMGFLVLLFDVTGQYQRAQLYIWLTVLLVLVLSIVILIWYNHYVNRIHEEMSDVSRQLNIQGRALESTINAVAITDNQGRIEWVNSAFSRLTGFDSDEVIGQNQSILYSENQDSVFYQNLWKTILSGQPWQGEILNQRKDGTKYMEEMSMTPVINSRGEITNFISIRQDISKRKEAEDQLLKEQQRLKVTLSSLQEGVLTVDLDGKIVVANGAAARILECTENDLLHKPLGRIWELHNGNGNGHVIDPYIKVLDGDRAYHTGSPLSLYTQKGRKTVIELSAAPIKNDRNQTAGVVMAFRDVSDRVKLEDELLKSRKLDSLAVLAGGIAHDFNNFLTAILGNISLAKFQVDKKEKLLYLLQAAERASVKAQDLTRQLMIFSKDGTPVTKTTSVRELIETSADFVLRGSSVTCQCRFDDNLWLGEIDEGQINQVVNNLLINAMQAMPRGGSIEVSGENMIIERKNNLPLNPGNFIKLVFKDHGYGIPGHNLQQIFDPYFTTKEKGSGLGLAISYKIIKNHGGHIDVQSTPGAGTEFTLYLPARLGKQREPKPASTASIPDIETGRILIMDDNEDVRQIAGSILEYLGYDYSLTANGEEAGSLYRQAWAENRPFDLVILDLTVPGGKGALETIEDILQVNPQARVILASGYTDDPVLAHPGRHGFYDVVSKPFTAQKLEELVKQTLVHESLKSASN